VKLGKKTILLGGLPIGLAVSGALAFVVLSGGSATKPEIPDPKAGQHGVMLALEERVVNLMQSGTAGYRYAKIGLTVELRPASADFYALVAEPRAAAEKIAIGDSEASVPLLLDALGRVVSARDSSQISGPQARVAVKAELLAAFRQILGEREVIDLYFTDLVMQ
jgi:flagellar basal body-associated protein FliL